MGAGGRITEHGVYALVVKVREDLKFTLKKVEVTLKPGVYVYIGSARGAGGVRARVSRHMRRSKIIKWHIDLVTSSPSAEVAGVVRAPTEEPECILVPELERLGFTHPVKGFGSSDCRRGCTSHFLAWDGDVDSCIESLRLAFQSSGLGVARVERV